MNTRNATDTSYTVMASEFIGELRDDGQLDNEGKSVLGVLRREKYPKQKCGKV